jgi:predicted oxidoreductase (fatty acid repression mutant protein)
MKRLIKKIIRCSPSAYAWLEKEMAELMAENEKRLKDIVKATEGGTLYVELKDYFREPRVREDLKKLANFKVKQNG